MSLNGVVIRDQSDFSAVASELSRRRQEGLRLYRSLPTQMPFHLSRASERIVRGGNRSGKTMCAAAEFASAVTRIPILGPDDNPLPFKYPADEPMTTWVIGYDEPHIARIYRKLFMPGLFRVIRDLKTKQLRAWRPWEKEDKEREDETKPSPPLIPERLVDPKGWAWENKAAQVFSVCRLTNGTSIYAFPSGGAAGQGDAVHLLWIDEDIKIPSHVQEWEARLSDVKGRLIWSVWPHTSNNALIDLSKRAKVQQHREDPDVFEIVLKFSDNPHIDEDEKRKRLEGWDADTAKSRDEGEFALDNVLVFPTFNADVHCVPSEMEKPDRLELFLRDRNYQVPIDWTNYLVVDPGHTQPAVLFAAVPPPWEFGDHVVIYDEIYVPRLEPRELARMVRDRSMGRVFEDFLIDFRAGRQTNLGFGKTTRQGWEEAFTECGLRSRKSGHSFTYGSDNVDARNMEVRGWLAANAEGMPKLRLIRFTTPGTQKEFGLYKKRVSKEDNVREEVVAENDHAMSCLGYLAAYNPQYAIHDAKSEPTDPIVKLWKKLEHKDEPESEFVSMGGGPLQSFF